MARLRNITVEWVSLVKSPAVRDPMNPEEPQRFLLTKQDTGDDMTTEVISKAEAIRKAEDRLVELKKTADDTSLSWTDRVAAKEASIEVQRDILGARNPAGLEQFDHRHGLTPVAKVDEDVDLVKVAQEIRKADPTLSEYDALLKAASSA